MSLIGATFRNIVLPGIAGLTTLSCGASLMAEAPSGKTTSNVSDKGTPYTLFVPDGVEKGQKDRQYPLIWVMDPSGRDGAAGVAFWRDFATERKVILLGMDVAGVRKQSTSVIEKIIEEYPVNRRKVFVEGFSAGGAMALQAGLQKPNLFAGIVTFGCGGINGAFEKSSLPRIVEHSSDVALYMIAGSADGPHLAMSKIHKQRLEEKGFAVTLVEIEGAGHGRIAKARADAGKWLLQQENKVIDAGGRVKDEGKK